jgi:hypothetical protein
MSLIMDSTFEGGIPILDQSLELLLSSPPHVEDPTSSKQKVQLDDVIERIERLNLNGNAVISISCETYTITKMQKCLIDVD